MLALLGLVACSSGGRRGSKTCEVVGATVPCDCSDGTKSVRKCSEELNWSLCECEAGPTTGGDTTGGDTTGGQTTGGETTGGETTGGGGECANSADAEVMKFTDIVGLSHVCGFDCVGQVPTCAQTCIEGKTGLSGGCAGCHADLINCSIQKCATGCATDPKSAGCESCQAEAGCAAAFAQCSGLDGGGETTGGETTGGETTGGETTGGETTGGETTGGETTGGETTGGETTGGETTGGETTGGGPIQKGDPCGAVTYEGCCQDNVLVWCADDGLANTLDCMQNPVCGWKNNSGYDCGSEGQADPTGAFPKACP